jgi:type VI secretion system protein ImpL
MLKYFFGLIFVALAWAACYVFQDLLSFRPAIAVTALVIFIFVLMAVYSSLKGKSAAKKIERALAGQAKDQQGSARPEVRAQIVQMQQEFDRAVGALKAKGQNALGVLPWYVIIGPPGSGKTTALSKSGLKFPYAGSGGRQKVKGVGGTRNCDWWLTNEAIILDTAGRWSVEEEDHDEWTAFLEQLKKTRPGKPINGIFLAVSVEDLQGEAEVEELAPKLRERIDDLMKRLDLVLPVYLLVTKCDLMPGFVESFADLRDKDLRQVWGTTFPIFAKPQERTDLLEGQLAELASVIERRALRRLGEERRPEARVGIYELPQQFHAVIEGVRALCGGVFTENVYQDAPILRGVYFTSGTQEGRLVDRLKNKMVEALGVRGHEAKGEPVLKPRSYFVHDVFRTIAFPDADVAVRSTRVLRKQKAVRAGVATAALAIAVGTLLLPVSAYRRNRQFVVELHDFVDRLGELHGKRDSGAWAPKLEEAGATADKLADYQKNGPGVGMTFGLYPGDRVLAPVAKAVSGLLLSPILHEDAREMQLFLDNRSQASDGNILGALTLHLLSTQPKEADEPNPQDEKWDEKWAGLVGQRAGDSWARLARERTTSKAQRTVEKAVTFYALRANDPSELPDRKGPVVTKVRQKLLGTGQEDPVKEAENDPAIRPAEIKLVDLASMAATLFKDGDKLSISAAFTPDGRTIVEKRLERLGAERTEDEWILGHRQPLTAPEIQKLKSRYFMDYRESWKAFLRKVALLAPKDLASAPDFLESINPQNVEPFWRNLAQYVTLTDLEGAAREGIGGKINDVRQKANALMGGNAPGARPKPGETPIYRALDVTREFEPFLKFGLGTAKPTALESYFTAVSTLQVALVGQAGKADAKEVQDAYKKARNTLMPLFLSHRGPGNWEPAVLEHMLMPPLNGANEAMSNDVQGSVNRKWCETVVFVYDEQLGGHYPFAPRATNEAKMADVASFFQKDSGTVWKYFNEALASGVDRVGTTSTFRFKEGAPVAYRDGILRFLRNAQNMTDMLFGRDPAKIGAGVSVRIHGTGPSKIVFEMGKAKTAYINTTERFAPEMPWPARGALFRLYERRNGQSEVESGSLEFGESEWALFHMFDRGSMKPSSDGDDDFIAGTWAVPLSDKTVRADFKPRDLWGAFRGFEPPPRQIVAGATPCR